MNSHERIDYSRWIPVFPLPKTVLMPCAILPLHAFEKRHRVMTRDALSGPRLIAASLLKPGYEPKYHTLDADIHPVVCLGRILREERLADGRYNFLLQGLVRARVIEENTAKRYRRAHLEPIMPQPVQPDRECALRRELRRLLTSPPLVEMAERLNWLDHLRCSRLSFSQLVDVLASAVLLDAEQKQAFLSEPRVLVRAWRLRDSLASLACSLEHHRRRKTRVVAWPPRICEN